MKPTSPIGSIISADITVDNPRQLVDFYRQVIGWDVESLSMNDESGTYTDYVIKDQAGNWTAGICHHRGVNRGIPPQWILYINVADIAQSLEKCNQHGGEIIKTSVDKGGTLQYAIIKDPSGAILALTKENGG